MRISFCKSFWLQVFHVPELELELTDFLIFFVGTYLNFIEIYQETIQACILQKLQQQILHSADGTYHGIHQKVVVSPYHSVPLGNRGRGWKAVTIGSSQYIVQRQGRQSNSAGQHGAVTHSTIPIRIWDRDVNPEHMEGNRTTSMHLCTETVAALIPRIMQ